jgi:hypothetical protein
MNDLYKLVDDIGNMLNVYMTPEEAGKEFKKWYDEVFIGKWNGKFPSITKERDLNEN